MSETIIVHEGESWRYIYDTTHCPEYDLIRMEGTLSAELVYHYMDQTIKHADERFGPEAKFCPRIVDVTQLWDAPSVVGALRALRETGNKYRRRYRLIVFVTTEALIGPLIYQLITQFVQATRRDVRFVGTVDEAVELIDTYWNSTKVDNG